MANQYVTSFFIVYCVLSAFNIAKKFRSCPDSLCLSPWLASLSPEIPLHITRFFPRYKCTDLAPTPAETIRRLCRIAEEDLRYVYPGNL